MTKMFLVRMALLFTVYTLIGSAWALEINGIVVDEAGKPVVNARIVAQGEEPQYWSTKGHVFGEGDDKGEGTSDTDGKFTINQDDLVSWGLTLVAIHPDYGIAVQYGHERIQQAGVSTYRIVMGKRGFIQGKVLDTTGKPVKEAEITVLLDTINGKPGMLSRVFIDRSILSTKTGTDGVFKLDGLPQESSVIIRATHPNYAPGVAGLSGDPRQIITGTIPVGSTDTVVTLQPGSIVEGRVNWEKTGTPVDHVKVMAIPDEIPASVAFIPLAVGVTDKKGNYSIKSLLPGKYTLKGDSFKEGVVESKTIDLTATAKMTGQDLTVTKGVLLAGKFISADTQKPVPRGYIEITSKDDQKQRVSLSAKRDGTFETRLAPGEVSVYANAVNRSLKQKQNKTLTLTTGQDQTDLIYEVVSPPYFNGRVLHADGQPIVGANVLLKDQFVDNWVRTNHEGHFEIQYPFSFFTRSDNTSFLEASHSDLPGQRGMLVKVIATLEDLNCDIVMRPVGILRGKVVTPDGKPVPSAKIATIIEGIKAGTRDREAVCDSLGQFEIKDAVGDAAYYTSVTSEKYGQVYLTKRVESGTTCDLGTVVLPAMGMTIEGTVTREEGTPIAGAWLSCHGDTTGQRNARSDAQGHFRIENVANESVDLGAMCYGPSGQLSTNARATGGDMDAEVIFKNPTRNSLPQEKFEGPTSNLLNKEAPPLEVAAWVAGTPVTLESLRGTPVLLAFVKTDDKVSEDLLTVLKSIGENYPKIPVLTIYNSNVDQTTLKKIFEAHNVKFHVAVDNAGATRKKYKAHVPAVFIIGADGKVQYQDLAFPAIETVLQSIIYGK